MSLTDAPTGFAVTDADSGNPLIYTGKTTSLKLALVNNSGVDIELHAGDQAASSFAFYPPRGFFDALELSAFALLETTGWSGSANKARMAFNIVCKQAGTWKNGSTLSFTLTNVTSASAAATGNASVVPANMGDNVSLMVTAPLAVATPPKPGNLSLADVLEVQLDSQGTIYRSVATDPLTNTLFLTIKNIGATPLATETDQRPGNPEVFVSFVYGATSGALAPSAYDPVNGAPAGSAWNIQIGIQSIQAPWAGFPPHWTSTFPDPKWRLAPDPTNFSILGPVRSDSANVTFSFSDIVSATPVGHTQMLVLCTGFAKDATTKYDDHLFVLDIPKIDPPPTRGLLSFAGVDPLIPVADPGEGATIHLRWSMFDVAKVQMLTSAPGVEPRRKTYPAPQPLAYDTDKIVLPPPLHTSQAIFTTLQAFDGNGGYLNSLQFTTYVQVSYVMDPANKVYPIALVGDTFWLMGNYDYAGRGNTHFYDDNPAYEKPYGRLYDLDAALSNPPPGWQLPSATDWEHLFAKYSYAQLVAGGSSGFDAQLGGSRTVNPNGSASYDHGPGSALPGGFYWAAPDSTTGPAGVQFSGSSQRVAVLPISDRSTGLSVRYVRHA